MHPQYPDDKGTSPSFMLCALVILTHGQWSAPTHDGNLQCVVLPQQMIS